MYVKQQESDNEVDRSLKRLAHRLRLGNFYKRVKLKNRLVNFISYSDLLVYKEYLRKKRGVPGPASNAHLYQILKSDLFVYLSIYGP
jgi:hypothetical protein